MFCPNCGSRASQDSKFCTSCGGQFSTVVQPPAKNAGFWFRVLAILIDTVFCQVIGVVIALPLAIAIGTSMAGSSTVAEAAVLGESLGVVFGVVIQWLWFTAAESSKWQATLGKKLLGLKVTDEYGNRISFGRANARYWSKVISGLVMFIGFIMVAFTKRKQGLHDLMAGTLVVRAKN